MTAAANIAEVPVAVLAGGLATRLKPLADEIPKALIDIAGEPFVSHQLRLLHARGFRRVVLCVGHLGEQIERAVGHTPLEGMNVEYAYDGPRLLGTAGALLRARDRLGPVFGVLYGDSYLDFDYTAAVRAFHAAGKPGIMVVFENNGKWDRSNVLFKAGMVLCHDKHQALPDMRFIDYGFSVLSAGALDGIPVDQPADLAYLYRDLAARDQLAGFEVTERFYEIGSPEGLEETRALLGRIYRATSV